MAWFIVSDVAERLLGKLAQWNDDEGLITHMGDTYFGGRDTLEQLKETLKMIKTKFVDAERRLFQATLIKHSWYGADGELNRQFGGKRLIYSDGGADANRGLSHRNEVGDADIKAIVKKLKHVLYGLEELLEEIQIVETQRYDQQSSSGWMYKLIKSLCMSASKPSLFRADVKLSESMVQQVKAVMARDWCSDMQQWRDHNNGTDDEGDHVDVLPDELFDRLIPLKQCLAYCSLFPEDYEYKKTDLINLWMAQGYLEPSNKNNQTPQQVGHQYFLDLVTMGVFYGETRNQIGNLWKMEGQFHYLAVKMAEDECLLVDGEPDEFIQCRNHVSFVIGDTWEAPPWLLAVKQLRSLLLFPRNSDTTPIIKNMGEALSSLKCLRTLDLGRADLENVLHTVDSTVWLKHLRYLNLGCPLESIPASITVLNYLQILDLRAGQRLTKCPDNLNKNVALLFSMEDYHQILVDESSSLNALIGSVQVFPKLKIFFKKHCQGAVSEATAADLQNKVVNDLLLEWSSLYQEPDAHADKDQDVLLRNLKPPSSLNTLVVRFWRGTRFPSWEPSPKSYVNLPNLVSIEVMGCDRCRYLPSFSRLPSLKYLWLADLKALEYIEVIEIGDEAGFASYFPSLENLKLEELPELMGWSKGTRQQAFHQLSQLEIYVCPKLMSLPRASTLDSICVQEIHGDLLKHIISTSSTNSRLLKRLQIDSIHQLSSLSVYPLPEEGLIIRSCEELVSITLSSSSYGKLEIHNCSKLRHFSGIGFKTLKFWRCGELKLWNIIEDQSPSWEHINSLTLGSMTKVNSFLMDIGDLAGGIKELYLYQLPDFRGLSGWLLALRKLHQLVIVDCPNFRAVYDPDCRGKNLFRNRPSLTIEKCRGLVDISLEEDIWGLFVCRCDRLRIISGNNLVMFQLEVDGCAELALLENNGVQESNDSSSSAAAAAACVGSAASVWESLSTVKQLILKRSSKLKHLPKGIACLSELKVLIISRLPNLRELPEWVGHLPQLTELEISDCPNMQFETSPGAVGSTTTWQSLKWLKLKRISKMVCLPEGMKCLTRLRTLEISELDGLSELPEWIDTFSELESLEIIDCPTLTTLPTESLCGIPSFWWLVIRRCNPELMGRCQKITGECWPKLQHIRGLHIG